MTDFGLLWKRGQKPGTFSEKSSFSGVPPKKADFPRRATFYMGITYVVFCPFGQKKGANFEKKAAGQSVKHVFLSFFWVSRKWPIFVPSDTKRTIAIVIYYGISLRSCQKRVFLSKKCHFSAFLKKRQKMSNFFKKSKNHLPGLYCTHFLALSRQGADPCPDTPLLISAVSAIRRNLTKVRG